METLENVQGMMKVYAQSTCIKTGECISRRYLWTDAFAVYNYLGLFSASREKKWLDKAVELVDAVHHTLGRYRSDDPEREGWISGLGEREGEMHPTLGGVRIGKKYNERKAYEPFVEREEKDQDGQYFHYLCKWIDALSLLGKATKEERYLRWAVELAQTAFSKFTYTTFTHERRIYWKMSIDLSYPLVSSMGQHDALDGYITYLSLQQNISESLKPLLQEQIDALGEMALRSYIATDDPLGIGETLSDACHLMQLICTEKRDEKLVGLLIKMFQESKRGMEKFMKRGTLASSAEHRLAFRELGLSIGLHGVRKMHHILEKHPECFFRSDSISSYLYDLDKYLPLSKVIEAFWLDEEIQKSRSYKEYEGINSMMLACSLHPEGHLQL